MKSVFQSAICQLAIISNMLYICAWSWKRFISRDVTILWSSKIAKFSTKIMPESILPRYHRLQLICTRITHQTVTDINENIYENTVFQIPNTYKIFCNILKIFFYKSFTLDDFALKWLKWEFTFYALGYIWWFSIHFNSL